MHEHANAFSVPSRRLHEFTLTGSYGIKLLTRNEAGNLLEPRNHQPRTPISTHCLGRIALLQGRPWQTRPPPQPSKLTSKQTAVTGIGFGLDKQTLLLKHPIARSQGPKPEAYMQTSKQALLHSRRIPHLHLRDDLQEGSSCAWRL